MVHRRHAQRDIAGRDAMPAGHPGRRVAQAAMRVHAGLGIAGGARGVGQRTQLIRPALIGRRREACAQRLRPAVVPAGRMKCAHPGRHGRDRGRGQIIGIAGDEQPGRTRSLGHRQQFPGADHQAGAAVGQIVPDFGLTVLRADRDDHRTQALHRIEADHPLRAVLHEQRDAIAARDALAVHPAGQRLNLPKQFRIAEGAAQEMNGGTGRIAPRRDQQVLGQRGLGGRDMSGPPCG